MATDIDFHVNIAPDPSKLARAMVGVNLTGFLSRQVSQLAFAVERYAKQLTPVDSGRLRASIHTTPMMFGVKAIVSTKTEYAVYVHEGTKYMRGRPFMKYGAMFAQVAEFKDINKRLDKHFTDAFKNSGFNK